MLKQEEYKYWYLRNHKLFSSLSNKQIEELSIIVRHKQAKKSEVLYFNEEIGDRIYFLKKGMIKIVEHNDAGDEIIKEIIQKGDLFGELALESGQESRDSAIAMSSEVWVCSFKTEDFENILSKNPGLAMKYFKFIGLKLKKLESKYSNLVFKDVKSRLIGFLKDWAISEGNKSGQYIVIPNYLTHQDIASMVCSTRQTITQILGELEHQGLVVYDRKEIRINELLTKELNNKLTAGENKDS